MKSSETQLADKIQRQKKETEQVLKILNNLWPLMEKLVHHDDGEGVDASTREVLMALGAMLGKETTKIEERSSSLKE